MKKACILILILALTAMPLAGALAAEVPPGGQYSIEVSLSGGSGRATVDSPAKLTISDGAMTARVAWSSPNYEYMLVDGAYYYPVNTEGNSVFEIPVLALDTDIEISAETLAMSEPHVIDYTLRFDSSTLKEPGVGQGAAIWILPVAATLAAGIIAAAVILKRKREKT